jgi:hypothetical protein
LTVGSSNYFSGTATVNGGRLVLNGPGFGSGAITVASTASLGGTGYVSGAVTVQTGAALAPGNPLAAGTFGISNAVSLAAGASYAWDYAGATNDSVNAVAVTFAGAWTLNASAVGITNGAYVLFRTTAGVTNFVAPTLVGVTGTVTLAGNDVVLTVGDLSTPFQSWQTLNFGSTTNANAAYDQDPDGDGANNLLEYAFGSAPTNGGSVALPQTGTSGNFLTITVPRNSNATDISYVVQGSSNLLDWATNVVLTATNPAPAGSTVTYTNGAAISAQPQQFLRVKVTQP